MKLSLITVSLVLHPKSRRLHLLFAFYKYINSYTVSVHAWALRHFRKLWTTCIELSNPFTISSSIDLVFLQVPRSSHLAEQLSSAYDCYLAILRHVDARVQRALGRDEHWVSRNRCPPCMYKLTDEPPLKFSMLAAIDGNNSLKLVDSTYRSGSTRVDDRISTSSRWIKPDDVDIFKDEVANSRPKVSAHFYFLNYFLNLPIVVSISTRIFFRDRKSVV